MNVLIFPPTHDSGLGEQFRQTTAALTAQNVHITRSSEIAPAPKFDLIHLFDAPDLFTALQSFVRARTFNAPIVVSPNYWNPTRFYEEGLAQADPPQGRSAELEIELRAAWRHAEHAAQRVLFRHAAGLIALSPSEATQLTRDFDVTSVRVILACNGVNPLFANATPDAFEKMYGLRDFVFCAARIEIRKNQWNLIRALREELLTLVFAGETLAPGYRTRCEREAQGGRARVIFLPPLDPEMLASAYAAARVHALASWHDCVALTPLEAAVAGCSIALSQEAGARDYLQTDAHYFDPANRKEIRNAVCASMNTPASPKLRERILNDYTWTRAAEQTRAAYEHALTLGNPTDTASYRADLENALAAFADYARLQDHARAELWREKMELTRVRDAYAQGRVMRLLNQLANLTSRQK